MKATTNGRIKNFLIGKIFGIILLFVGAIGFMSVFHQVFSYETLIRPHLDVFYPDCTGNNVSGANYLSYFTLQSNIFVSVFALLESIGLLFSPKLLRFTHNDALRGAVTLYIAVTGIIFCSVLLPFLVDFPWQRLWFSNLICYNQHIVIPLFFIIWWFFPSENTPLNYKNALWFLVYPLTYFIVSMIRGGADGFYPYPFLNAVSLWGYVSSSPFNAAAGYTLLCAVIIALVALFYFLGRLLIYIHNRRIKNY